MGGAYAPESNLFFDYLSTRMALVKESFTQESASLAVPAWKMRSPCRLLQDRAQPPGAQLRGLDLQKRLRKLQGFF